MTAKVAKAPTKKTKTTKPKAKVTSKAKTVSKLNVTEQPVQKKKPVDAKQTLRTWNLRLGILLVVLAIAVIVVGTSYSVPVTTQYLAKDTLSTAAAGGREVLGVATRHLIDVHLSWVVAKFLLVFGAVFLLAATLLRSKYEAWLDRGVNVLRWVGLGVGGGVVFVAASMIGGVSDISTLCLVFGSVALSALLAASTELIGEGRKLRRALGLGALLAVFLPWLIFVRTAGAKLMYDGSLPVYVYFLYASVTLLVAAVALATYWRIKKRGLWSDTMYTEKMFIGLTLAFAVLPALQIFAGALQP